MLGVCSGSRGIADPEERGQVQGIRPVGQGFLEVAIHAEPIERYAAVPKEFAEVGAANGLETVGACPADQEEGVGA